MTGAEIQRAILKLLVVDGWLVIRPNSGAMETEEGRYVIFIRWLALGYAPEDGKNEWNTKGVSDILAFHPARGALAVEVKGDGDTLKPEQELFLEAWEQAGGVSIVAESVEAVGPYLVRTEVQ